MVSTCHGTSIANESLHIQTHRHTRTPSPPLFSLCTKGTSIGKANLGKEVRKLEDAHELPVAKLLVREGIVAGNLVAKSG